ncbi:MAG: FAD binding domain-containing protein [Oscillospiraceae bacterium]|nr:FAD binding domain-containing protein [Oscillospiraceae bacterium]
MNQVEMLRPKGLAEAFSMMESKKGTKLMVLAGGTDIIPPLREKAISVDCFLDILGLGLGEIREQADGVSVGATCTMKQVAESPIILKHFPSLAKATRSMGAGQTRAIATIGGNLCSGVSCLDSMPPLLVHDAVFTLTSANGTRQIPANEFLAHHRKSQLKVGEELLTEIFLPFAKPGFKADFIKFGRRKALSLSLVNVGFGAEVSGGVFKNARAAVGSCAPTPVRAVELENYLEGKSITQIDFDEVGRLVKASISPISDIRASAEYRSDLSAALICKLVRAVAGKE